MKDYAITIAVATLNKIIKYAQTAESNGNPTLFAAHTYYTAHYALRDILLRVGHPIETAPKDGTTILVYAPPRDGLSFIVCECAYHPDAGFCVDEIRQPELWMPLS